MNECVIVIFGITGDLAKRKLIPAIYHLIADKKITNVAIVGVGLEDTMNVSSILTAARPFIAHPDEEIMQYLSEHMHYQPMNFLDTASYAGLKKSIEQLEKKDRLPGNRLFYLASAADFFCTITTALGDSGLAQRLTEKQPFWHRIVYEKPFGYDLSSAHVINTCIQKYFDENQIYRIDHYLTKELVSNIALIRFTNCIFEPLWNNQYISQVQVILSESGGIEGRGLYYDGYGALRDVVQNHMLELIALIAMEAPTKLTGDFIREQRARVLEKIIMVDGMRGQYSGYTEEKNVKANSTTETFAVLQLKINNPRWSGVPFYLKTGKKLDKKETIIHIKFKQVDCLLMRGCPIESNWLTLRVAPDATVSLSLNAKKPGKSDEIVPISMEFSHSAVFGNPGSEKSYETLFEEVMRGEQSVSVRFDEIEYAWRVIDMIDKARLPLYSYAPGSCGPTEVVQFESKHGMRWKS
jgi:glucose-6-phosphate 1-dehydrogenase